MNHDTSSQIITNDLIINHHKATHIMRDHHKSKRIIIHHNTPAYVSSWILTFHTSKNDSLDFSDSETHMPNTPPGSMQVPCSMIARAPWWGHCWCRCPRVESFPSRVAAAAEGLAGLSGAGKTCHLVGGKPKSHSKSRSVGHRRWRI